MTSGPYVCLRTQSGDLVPPASFICADHAVRTGSPRRAYSLDGAVGSVIAMVRSGLLSREGPRLGLAEFNPQTFLFLWE